MRKSTIVIVEDDPTLVRSLKEKLPKIGCDVVGVFSEGEKASHELQELNPELVLVDISLHEDLGGIEAAQKIREVNDVPIVYLARNLDSSTLEKCRKTNPYGYIVSPFHELEAHAIIDTAIHKHAHDVARRREHEFFLSMLHSKRENSHIFIKSDYKIKRIELEDICFVEALKDYIAINTFNQTHTTHISMKDILKILPDKDFVRVHRSFIVRINKILSIKYPELMIEGSSLSLPMGGLYKKDVYDRLNIV